ncbi:hypothetical protein JEQ12_019081 [Ovis aries]|uniref:Uncharacterized protein n=1 Tax=Ovis aries TaxID=9940 RepID=A0A836A922_SHEEP|nr:hypothetical protein JEQ12_019081 [Ovis aries]
MSSKRAKTTTTKKCPQCTTSNVVSMFNQSQIQEFREVFNMIVYNRDGFAQGSTNFAMFLTKFGEKLNGADLEDVIGNAFTYFDELLAAMGNRFTGEEMEELYREAPIDKKGSFHYIAFMHILKHGTEGQDD